MGQPMPSHPPRTKAPAHSVEFPQICRSTIKDALRCLISARLRYPNAMVSSSARSGKSTWPLEVLESAAIRRSLLSRIVHSLPAVELNHSGQHLPFYSVMFLEVAVALLSQKRHILDVMTGVDLCAKFKLFWMHSLACHDTRHMYLASTLQIKRGLGIVSRLLHRLERTLTRMSEACRDVPMEGRTHFQHTLPITFGYKRAFWLAGIRRQLRPLKDIRDLPHGAVWRCHRDTGIPGHWRRWHPRPEKTCISSGSLIQ